jgi:hypothetical protein
MINKKNIIGFLFLLSALFIIISWINKGICGENIARIEIAHIGVGIYIAACLVQTCKVEED